MNLHSQLIIGRFQLQINTYPESFKNKHFLQFQNLKSFNLHLKLKISKLLNHQQTDSVLHINPIKTVPISTNCLISHQINLKTIPITDLKFIQANQPLKHSKVFKLKANSLLRTCQPP